MKVSREEDIEPLLIPAENYSSNFVKALIWLFQYLDDTEILWTDQQLKDFIMNYIDDADKFLDLLNRDTRRLYHITVLSERGKLSDGYHPQNCAYLLKAYFLFQITDQDVNKWLPEYLSFAQLNDLYSQIVSLNMSVSSVFMNYVFENNQWLNYEERYHPNILLMNYLSNLCRESRFIENVIQDLPENEFLMCCVKTKTQFEKMTIISGIHFIKLQTLLLTMAEVPFYSCSAQKIARNTALLFRDFLADVRVVKIIIEPNLGYSDQETGFRRSTQIEIFFIYKKLFWKHNNLYWFRQGFEQKLEQVFPDKKSEEYQALKLFFRHRSHLPLVESEMSLEDVKAFLVELADGMKRMNMGNCVYDRTRAVDIDETLLRIRVKEAAHEASMGYFAGAVGLWEPDGAGGEFARLNVLLKQKLIKSFKSLLGEPVFEKYFLEEMSVEEILEAVQEMDA
ncbi:MAG: hypothetical protein HFG65_11565 [Hungatella sp.]|nr:hypothetical protein [Hungatella sp.]